MDKVKKNFGFGFMRLPMIGEEVDNEQVCQMVDTFLEMGFNYFDTAHGYIDGKSEIAIRECLSSRHPRERYIMTNKLSSPHFTCREDIRPLLESQLEACGVDYFDFYLMHAQSSRNYQHYTDCQAYEEALVLKAEGKIRHLGISFHDKASFLEKILKEHPEVEVVQIQFNYADFDSDSVESRKCYEVCRKYGKPVIVMEPVKGGKLVELPEEAQKVFDDLGCGSAASYAIRFAAGFEGIFMVLSGMGNMDMIRDNCGYMQNFQPLNEQELEAVRKVCEILSCQNTIPCTACRYCTENCPAGIPIPELFACMNAKKTFRDWSADYYYHDVHTTNGGKASACVKCGGCEEVCPQHLPIRALLEEVAATFEPEEE